MHGKSGMRCTGTWKLVVVCSEVGWGWGWDRGRGRGRQARLGKAGVLVFVFSARVLEAWESFPLRETDIWMGMRACRCSMVFASSRGIGRTVR